MFNLQDPIFSNDAVLPEQFYAVRSIASALQGERRLLWAVLEQVIDSLQGNWGKPGARAARIVREDEAWLLAEHDDGWLYSFYTICATFDIDPQRLREGIMGLRAKPIRQQSQRHYRRVRRHIKMAA